MKKLLKQILVCTILSITICSANLALAAGETGGTSGGSGSSGSTVTIPPIIPAGGNQNLLLPHNASNDSNQNYVQNRLLPGITSVIISLTGGIALIMVIVAGIQLLTSGGDPAVAGKAKKTITFALAGIIIAVLSYGIVAIIASINVAPPTPPK